jgi:hypothetical protein
MTSHIPIKKNSEFTSTLTRIDSNCFVLEVFWEQKPSGGYRIRIDHWEIIDSDLLVTVTTKKPKPGDMVTMALTYPKANTTICDTQLHEKFNTIIKKSMS